VSASQLELSTPTRRKAPRSKPAATADNSIAERSDVKAITAETEQLATVPNSYTITTADEYTAGALELQKIKGAQKRLTALQKSITQPLEKAKKAAIALFKGPKAKLDAAELVIKSAMDVYIEDQKGLRLQEQAKADEDARKQQMKLQQQAAKAAASGKVEKATALEQRALAVVAPAIQRAAPKVDGIVTKEVWKYEITDPNQVPRNYCSPDAQKIGGVVDSLKGDTDIPGVRVWKVNQIAAGAA
jgi:hypothetical protein